MQVQCALRSSNDGDHSGESVDSIDGTLAQGDETGYHKEQVEAMLLDEDKALTEVVAKAETMRV